MEYFALSLATAGAYYVFNWREELIRMRFRTIAVKSGIFNKKEQSFRVHQVNIYKWGFNCTVGIPFGLSIKTLEDKADFFRTGFGAKELKIERMPKASMAKLTFIQKPLQEVTYEPIECEGHEIYPGFNHIANRKISLNKFPHVLIGGSTGTGKSRLMLCILTNLIANNKNIEIFIMQLRKGDLKVFSRCRQVKYFADNLKDARNTLAHLNKLCVDRDKIIDKHIFDGIYNIEDYNKRFPRSQMSYIHACTDEFAFFIPSKADTPEEKKLKQQCLAYIKNIVLTGRSVGVFLYTSLQRPDKSSIPADIKAQLNIRVSFKQRDDSSSIAILGNGNATDLQEREAILQLTDEEIIRVPYIDDRIIKQYIGSSIELGHRFITLDDSNIQESTEEFNYDDGIIDDEVLKNVDFKGF